MVLVESPEADSTGYNSTLGFANWMNGSAAQLFFFFFFFFKNFGNNGALKELAGCCMA